MLGIQHFKNFYKWGCLFLGIPVDVFRQDGLMVWSSPQRSPRRGVEWLAEPPARLQRPEDSRHGLTGSLSLKILKTSGVGVYVNVRGCYSFKYNYREIYLALIGQGIDLKYFGVFYCARNNHVPLLTEIYIVEWWW